MPPEKSTASPTPGPSKPKISSQIKSLGDGLYDHCSSKFGPTDLIFQDELLQSNVIPENDLKMLMEVVQHLVDRKLLKMHQTSEKRLAWKIVPRESAEKYNLLSSREETLVYQTIESAGNAGIWSGHVKFQTNIHQQKVQKTLKILLQKGMVKTFISAKHSGRKMYILKHVKPSDTAGGGSWFTDGELDQDFVSAVGNYIILEVSSRSWIKVEEDKPTDASIPGKKRKERMSTLEVEDLRASVLETPDSDEAPRKRMKTEDGHRNNDPKSKARYLRHEPGYTGYPTLDEITTIVNTSELTSGITLASQDISQLLDVLCWDERLYKIEKSHAGWDEDGKPNTPDVMYKTLINRDEAQLDVAQRRSGKVKVGRGNGLTDIPCGRCPVFDLCEEGGPVNANNCKYFDEWFKNLGF